MTTIDPLDSEPELLTINDTCTVEDSTTQTSSCTRENNVEKSGYTEEKEENVHKPNLTIVNRSKLYVISIDGKPKFYVSKRKDIVSKVEEIMKYLTTVYPDYDMYSTRISSNTWQVTKRNRWFVISSEEVIHTIKCNTIRQIEFN